MIIFLFCNIVYVQNRNQILVNEPKENYFCILINHSTHEKDKTRESGVIDEIEHHLSDISQP